MAPFSIIRALMGGKDVKIENNAEWNFKDLEEMLGSAKTLKRNNRERKEILIGPSMAPRFFQYLRFLRSYSFAVGKLLSASGSNFAARMASRQHLGL